MKIQATGFASYGFKGAIYDKETIVAHFFALISFGCSQHDNDSSSKIVTMTIFGSAEQPDPVLERVLKLEKQGILSDVQIMESFPVQIRITGQSDIIKELESMPRKN